MERADAERELALMSVLARELKKRFGYRNDYLLTDLMPSVRPWGRVPAPRARRMWEREAAALRAGARRQLNCFVEVPWCASRCAYCVSPSAPLPSRGALADHVERVAACARYLSGALEGAAFSTLYVGGGSPSLLSSEQVAELFGGLFEMLEFEQGGERTFEANPAELDDAMARALALAGFNRVSLGVQSMDEGVLARAARLRQDEGVVRRAVAAARAAGIPYLGCDLILGLEGEDAGSFLSGFERLAALGPDSVCVYPLQPTDGYLAKAYHGDLPAFEAHLARLSSEVLGPLGEAASRHGMSLVPPAILRPASASPWFVEGPRAGRLSPRYNFDDPGACSVLGLGLHSESVVFGQARYRTTALSGPGPCGGARFEGYAMDGALERRAWALRTLAARRGVPSQAYRYVFGTDPSEDMRSAWDALEAVGALERRGGELALLPEGAVERFVHAALLLDRSDVLRRLDEAMADNVIELQLEGGRRVGLRVGYARRGAEPHVRGGTFSGVVVSDEEGERIRLSAGDRELLARAGRLLEEAAGRTADAREAGGAVARALGGGSRVGAAGGKARTGLSPPRGRVGEDG